MKLKQLLLPLILLTASAFGQKTQLAGTLTNPDGTGFTGFLYLSLSQVSGISPNNSCGGPVQVVPAATLIVTVANGAMASYVVQGNTTVTSGPPKIYGSDCTLPTGVPYNAVLRDPQGNVIFSQQWLIVGNTQDIGTVVSDVPNPQASYLAVIPGTGSPTGICSNNQQYLQLDATPGINIWSCVNSAWVNQVGSGGGGGGGMAIGSAVVGSSHGSALFVDNSGNLAQDTSNYSYDPINHILNLLNLTVTNTITGSVSGNAATATLASNSTQVGGIALSGLCQTGGTGCPTGLAVGGSTGDIQAKSALGGLQASDLADNFGVAVTSAVPIILPANPTTALQATTKQYVDSIAAGFTGAVLSGPASSQVITQPDGTTFAINNAGTSSGVIVSLGAHVNLAMVAGTVSFISPDTLTTLGLTNTGITLQPSSAGYLNLGGRLTVSSTTLTTSTTIGINNESVDFIDATSGNLTETLPAANATTTYDQTYSLAKVDSTTHTVTIAAGSGDTINGATTFVISGQYNGIKLVSNGSHNWLGTSNSVTSGIMLQTNNITNPIQSILNLVNGPGITVTNDISTGKTQITNTYAINPTPIGVSQNVDWPPTITNAMNDEFTDSVFNTSNIWTVVNQGSDTVVNKNSLLSVGAVAHSGDNFVGIYQLTPSTPFAVTAKITLTGLDASGYYGGLAFRDGGTGKVVTLRIGNGSTLTVDHFTNPTTLAGNVFSQLLDADQTIYITLKDDGTNFTFSFSRDGVNFITVYTESRTAFLASPGQVGYIAGSSNASNAMAMGSDWFRRTL